MTSNQQPTPSVEEARKAVLDRMSDPLYWSEHVLLSYEQLVEAAVRAPLEARIAELEQWNEDRIGRERVLIGEVDDHKRRAEAAEKVVETASRYVDCVPERKSTIRELLAALAEYDAQNKE